MTKDQILEAKTRIYLMFAEASKYLRSGEYDDNLIFILFQLSDSIKNLAKEYNDESTPKSDSSRSS